MFEETERIMNGKIDADQSMKSMEVFPLPVLLKSL